MTGPGDGLRPFLQRLAAGETLDESEAEAAFDRIMDGAASPAQIGALLMGLRVRGETVPEIVGAARAMRARALMIEAPAGAIDTCGTGGDGRGSFNISTAAAFVIAGCGVKVAKHGNRNLSSRSGSADVLRALGVTIEAALPLLRRSLEEAGLCFLYAPRHHEATRAVAPVRLDLGTRTIFNLLGPLANPAGVRRQVVGVFDPGWVRPVAEVLQRLGAEACWVVHGDGLDELTTTGESQIAALAGGTITNFTLEPEAAGLVRVGPEALAGGSPEDNAGIMRALLDGAPGPIRDVVMLNAAAGLIVAGAAPTLRDGMLKAAASLDSGAARLALTRLVAITGGAL